MSDNEFWSRHHVTACVPSASCFVRLCERRRTKRPLESILAVGPYPSTSRPEPAPAASRGQGARVLPSAGAELHQIAALFRTRTILADTMASEVRLAMMARNGDLNAYGVIHVATHAGTGSLEPWRQAMDLAGGGARPGVRGRDGRLDAREIWNEWSIEPSLVTLSACVTARGAGWHGGEFLGLNQVLLGAGAESVLSSIWDVNDKATQLLMGRFYANLLGRDPQRPELRPMTKAAALHEARCWLRERTETNGTRPWEHWIYWAGFVLSGLPD